MYAGYYIYDHILHFYYLGGPDFVVGPDAPAAKRNVLGVIEKAGVDVGKEVIKHRAYGQKITAILGGKATQPVCGLPGGVSKGLNKDEVKDIETMAKSCKDFAQFTLKIFDDIVLANKAYVDLILSDLDEGASITIDLGKLLTVKDDYKHELFTAEAKIIQELHKIIDLKDATITYHKTGAIRAVNKAGDIGLVMSKRKRSKEQ